MNATTTRQPITASGNQLFTHDGQRTVTHLATCNTQDTAESLAFAWNTLPKVVALLKRLMAFEQRLKVGPMDGGTLLGEDARALLDKISNR